VFCAADVEVLMTRMRERIAANQRHPGHVDDAALAELENELRNRPLQPLPLGQEVLVFDSSRDRLEQLVVEVEKRLAVSG
jgi:hypothetical protein